MAPLIVMISTCLVARAAGVIGPGIATTWQDALRVGLACMFLFTAVSHFHPRTRTELIQMVPPLFPAAAPLVTVTGLLELLGAAGLLLSRTRSVAAYGLVALLVAMFPANVHAARARLQIAGRPASPLALRLPLQLFWIAALWWVA